ncbi:MAG: serine hydrolase domain-containing protein [Blastocatellia bacterium]
MNLLHNQSRRALRLALALTLATLLLVVGSLAQNRAASTDAQTEALTAKVDKLFVQWDKPDSPGCALGVIKDGRFIYKRGYGIANLDHSIPLSPTSVFYIASTSKQFAAASVALLARQGKISLDDDIRKYLPEMPQYRRPVTIRHLAHHTSGIRDYLTLMSLAGMRYEDVYSEEELVAIPARQKELNFTPGDEHLYSNSGYFLLSVIVKRALGKSLRQFADEQIFKPLGMSNTHFHDDRAMVVKNRVTSYFPQKEGAFGVHVNNNFDKVGDGGLLTTVEDLARWDRNFYDYQVGGKEFVDQLLTPGQLNSGEKLTYAFGLSVGEYKGLKTVSHGGGFFGFRTEMIRFPDQKFSVICLCNLGSINAGGLARQVAEIYLADQLMAGAAKRSDTSAKPAFIDLPEAELKNKTGVYRNAATGSIWKLFVSEAKLWVNPVSVNPFGFQLAPLSATHFRRVNSSPEVDVKFQQSGADQHWAMQVEVPGQKPMVFTPTELATPSAAQLAEYAGDYYSEELNVTYQLAVEGGKLMLRRKTAPVTALFPAIKDEFRVEGSILNFIRNDQQRPVGFTLNAGRVKNLYFAKRL